jgi:acyl-CoA hydrolase
MDAKKVSESLTTMTQMVMPNDTNPLGNLMGGNLMRWMDIVAGICAGKHCAAHVVTVSVDNVSFDKPIHNGDVVTLHACVTRAFNTSVEIFVEVFAANILGKNPRKCNDAFLTFVALDETKRKPIKVSPVLPLTGEEENRFDAAMRRRELRLLLSGRIEVEDAKNIQALFLKK